MTELPNASEVLSEQLFQTKSALKDPYERQVR